MSDSKKTKKELLAEIEALRAKLGAEPAAPETEASDGHEGGLTRRDILASAWVAPVILTVPLGVAMTVNPQRANAQTGSPTTVPTTSPSAAPTTVPTTAPTSAPTAIPTAFPTVSATGAIPVELSEFDIS